MIMLDLQEPRPGYWYINRTGKLMKVRMVMYGIHGAESVLLQYVEGSIHTISMLDWQCLDLVAPHDGQDDVVLESDSAL
jgi:hypothetical protein